MARTKQTARKSSGGKAPRKQLACNSKRSLRTFFTSQQSAGQSFAFGGGVASSTSAEKKIFINCENTFGEFSFPRTPTTEILQPIVTTTRAVCFETSSAATVPRAGDVYMKIDFSSRFDGNIQSVERPPLDIVFVLDISGSMGTQFPNDTDRRCKLEVAKDCIEKVVSQLRKGSDRIALITFNQGTHVESALKPLTTSSHKTFIDKLHKVRVAGGTDLCNGLRAGYSLLRNQNKKDALQTAGRMQRVFFLTDMESSAQDEAAVYDLARREALGDASASSAASSSSSSVLVAPSAIPPRFGFGFPHVPSINQTVRSVFGYSSTATGIASASASAAPVSTTAASATTAFSSIKESSVHFSVMGIGVDLSVASVELICAIPGAKYVSVISAEEMCTYVESEFYYDVIPIALDLKLSLSPSLKFAQFYGSAELNSVRNESTAIIATEFAVPVAADGTTKGGLYLCKLVETGGGSSGGTSSLLSPTAGTRKSSRLGQTQSSYYVDVTWNDIYGAKHSTRVGIDMPCPITLPVVPSTTTASSSSSSSSAFAFSPSSSISPISAATTGTVALSPDCDLGLRKALALEAYVRCLTEYTKDDDDDDDDESDNDSDSDSEDGNLVTAAHINSIIRPVHWGHRGHHSQPGFQFATGGMVGGSRRSSRSAEPWKPLCSREVVDALHSFGAAAIAEAPHEQSLPLGTPEKVLKHYRFASHFIALKEYLVSEMQCCGDMSLSTYNSNIMDTVQQIITMETKIIERLVKRTKAYWDKQRANASSNNNNTSYGTANIEEDITDVPRGFICPITLTLMSEPVIAADGHSYDKKAMKRWLRNQNTSPVTNLRLEHKNLIPNFALAAAIQDYREKKVSKDLAASTEAIATAVAAAAAEDDIITDTTFAPRDEEGIIVDGPNNTTFEVLPTADTAVDVNTAAAAAVAANVGTSSSKPRQSKKQAVKSSPHSLLTLTVSGTTQRVPAAISAPTPAVGLAAQQQQQQQQRRKSSRVAFKSPQK